MAVALSIGSSESDARAKSAEILDTLAISTTDK
jgi:hypothetical protein